MSHEHEWRLHSHADGCHWHTTTWVCECGAVETGTSERNLRDPDDPYAAVFAVDDCQRCQELLKGAEPKVLT